MLNLNKQNLDQHPEDSIQIVRKNDWLIVEFPRPVQTLSWAVTGGGKTLAQRVVWRQVRHNELNCPMDPADYLAGKLKEENLDNAVGLLTSAKLDEYVYVRKDFGLYWANCVATVGMGNALRVADFPTASNHVGTINVLCQVSVPLSEGAFLEAVSIAAEARTLAVRESEILSFRTQKPATGTGTDCIVIAAPDVPDERKYAGKHTVIGYLIGSSVLEAVRLGIERWTAQSLVI